MMQRDESLRGLINQQVVLRPLLGAQVSRCGGCSRGEGWWFCWGDKNCTEEAITESYKMIYTIQ